MTSQKTISERAFKAFQKIYKRIGKNLKTPDDIQVVSTDYLWTGFRDGYFAAFAESENAELGNLLIENAGLKKLLQAEKKEEKK